MSYNATENSASRRIALMREALLRSAVLLQHEALISTCRQKILRLTV